MLTEYRHNVSRNSPVSPQTVETLSPHLQNAKTSIISGCVVPTLTTLGLPTTSSKSLSPSSVPNPVSRPIIISSGFVEFSASSEKRVKFIQIDGYNEVSVTLKDGQNIPVEPCFLDLPKRDNVALANYLGQTHLVVKEMSGGSYKIETNAKIIGGGLCGSKEVAPLALLKRNDIHFVVRAGDVQAMVRILRDNIPSKYPIDTRDNEGNTPLHLACSLANIQIVQLIVDKMIQDQISDIDLIGSRGQTALHKACDQTSLDSLGCVKILVANGASINKKSNDQGYTPLRCAVESKREDIVDYLLNKSNAKIDIDAIDNQGITSLSFALKNGFLSIAELLIKKGADLGRISPTDYVELSVSARDLLKRLRGYQPNQGINLEKDFLKVIEEGNIDKVNKFIKAGVNVNCLVNDFNTTPLYFAKRLDIAEALCNAGANVNAINTKGWAPLGAALSDDDRELAKFLSSKGAIVGNSKTIAKHSSKNQIMNALTNACGEFILDKAAAKTLIDAGGDINLPFTDRGFTPFYMAVSWSSAADLDVATRAKHLVDYLITLNPNIDHIPDDGSTLLAQLSNAYRIRADKDHKRRIMSVINLLIDHGANPDNILPSVYQRLDEDTKHLLYTKRLQYKARQSASVSASRPSQGGGASSSNVLNDAFNRGDLSSARNALSNGIRPDSQTLTLACFSKDMDLINAVLEAGARPDQETLTAACATGILAIVQKALGAGARATEKTYTVARSAGNKQILSLLGIT